MFTGVYQSGMRAGGRSCKNAHVLQHGKAPGTALRPAAARQQNKPARDYLVNAHAERGDLAAGGEVGDDGSGGGDGVLGVGDAQAGDARAVGVIVRRVRRPAARGRVRQGQRLRAWRGGKGYRNAAGRRGTRAQGNERSPSAASASQSHRMASEQLSGGTPALPASPAHHRREKCARGDPPRQRRQREPTTQQRQQQHDASQEKPLYHCLCGQCSPCTARASPPLPATSSALSPSHL